MKISLLEVVKGNEILFILLYCCIILWINIGYLKEHKQIKKNLEAITDEEEKTMMWTADSISIMLFTAAFNFFRRWLFYIIAFLMTSNNIVLIIAVLLFIISLYDTVFNITFAQLKKSNIAFYLAVIDTILIIFFALYLFLYH